jgi:uncharacterized protein YkwD
MPVCIKGFYLLLVIALLGSCESIGKSSSDFKGSGQTPAASAESRGSAGPIRNNQTAQNASQAKRDAMPAKWKKETIDTTTGTDYLTENERQIIIEINMVRTDPAEYAHRFLAPLRSSYHDKLLQFPGEIAISTNEGIPALDECIKKLEDSRPLSPLVPRKGLTLAARDHARDQGKSGATGHTGSDTSTMESRLKRYGRWEISAGENIDYGNGDARRIVASLLIDDGVPSRGHRSNLLDRSFKVVGVAVGPHHVYGHMCVMDFAGSYR